MMVLFQRERPRGSGNCGRILFFGALLVSQASGEVNLRSSVRIRSRLLRDVVLSVRGGTANEDHLIHPYRSTPPCVTVRQQDRKQTTKASKEGSRYGESISRLENSYPSNPSYAVNPRKVEVYDTRDPLTFSEAVSARGGSSNHLNNPSYNANPYNRHPYNTDILPQQSEEQHYEPPPMQDQETVQDRVDHWRTHQEEVASQMQNSPRDEKGRMKLLTSVGKGSRAIFFFFLMWRDVLLYERAAYLKSTAARLLVTVPLIFLFILNMSGAVASVTSPSHSAKKRLKAILNLDKVVEIVLVFYAVLRLTIFPNQYSPRELYFGNILHSFFFLVQAQAFTRFSWDENSAQPMSSFAQASQEQQTDGLVRDKQQAWQSTDWYDLPPNQL